MGRNHANTKTKTRRKRKIPKRTRNHTNQNRNKVNEKFPDHDRILAKTLPENMEKIHARGNQKRDEQITRKLGIKNVENL